MAPNKKLETNIKNKTFNFSKVVKNFEQGNAENIKSYLECRKYLPDKKIVALDIGARWGEWTKLLQADFQHVYSFEPHQLRYKFMEYNCPPNNFTLFRTCLGDENKSVTMYAGSIYDNKNEGVEQHFFKKEKLCEQPCIKLDDLKIQNVDFIKIDVEGYELPVIKGGLKTILKYKPVICLEQNGSETKWRGCKTNEAMEFLISQGMKVVKQLNKQDFLLVWE